MDYKSYEVNIIDKIEDAPEMGNVDVEVKFDNGQRYGASFFTLDNIEYLFRKNAETGECLNGLYFWATHMVLVQRLNHWTIERSIEDMLTTGEFETAFERFPNRTDEELLDEGDRT